MERKKKVLISVVLALVLILQIFSFRIEAYTSGVEVIDAFGDWVTGNSSFGEFVDIFEDAVDIFGYLPEHEEYVFNPETLLRFFSYLGINAEEEFENFNDENGGNIGRKYQYYVRTNHRMTDPLAYTGPRRSEMIWYFNVEEDDPFFPVYYNGTYYINTGSVKVTDCVMYLKNYDKNDFSLYYHYTGNEYKILPNHPDGYIWRLTPQSDGIDNTNYYVHEHNLPLEWPSGVDDTSPPSLNWPDGVGNTPSIDNISNDDLIGLINFIIDKLGEQEPPPKDPADLSNLEDILNAILDKINDITVGLTDNPVFEWPEMPAFVWPPMPEIIWPEPPELKWPEAPVFEWPEMPEFEWPELPDIGIDVDFNMTKDDFNLRLLDIKADWESKFEFIENIRIFLVEGTETLISDNSGGNLSVGSDDAASSASSSPADALSNFKIDFSFLDSHTEAIRSFFGFALCLFSLYAKYKALPKIIGGV